MIGISKKILTFYFANSKDEINTDESASCVFI